jgi:hypothetical protein
MAPANAAPDKALPPEAVDLDAYRVRNFFDGAGGVVREYRRAA